MLTALKPHVETVALRITPLTPIHIGCGIDFDPTGYVIDDGVLFHFDAAQVPLNEADRRALLGAVQRPGAEALLSVQRFFHERSPACIGAARLAVPVAAGVAVQYAKRIGSVAQAEARGQRVTNNLEIERTSHHPHTGMAYLPGSSLKGAMRTAWLDKINNGRPGQSGEKASALEARLLDGGKFETDPFRLVRVGDAQGAAVASQVVFSTNHKKREVVRDGVLLLGRGPTARRECVAPAQWAALRFDLSLDGLAGQHIDRKTPAPAGRIGDWQRLAAACQRYYLPRLRVLLDLLDTRRLAHPAWLAGVRALLSELAPQMARGEVVLLRAGRHSGAESVTLDGVRDIKIMKGPKEQPAYSSEGATTVWLAAHDETARSDMQPFGWLLLHRDGVELPALQAWCALQAKPEMAAAQTRLAQARDQAQRDRVARDGQVAEQQARLEAERQAAEHAAQRRQSLSPEGRAVADLEARLLAHTSAKKQAIGGALWPAVAQLMAASSAWAEPADRLALAALLTGQVPQKIELGSKAKDVKQAVARLCQAQDGTP